MGRRSFRPVAIVSALAALLALVIGAPAIGAQDSATPSAIGEDIELYPAHIHFGTCEDLGDIAYPLNDLQAAARVASPEAQPNVASAATPDASGVSLGDAVAQSGTVVDVSLDELLSDQYAINVHKSAEEIDVYIACGNIEGEPTDGELVIQLHELNDSGFAGEAHLADNGDGTTTVHVSLIPASVAGTPVATPSS